MVILTYEVRMDGLLELAKETVAMELEESLNKIGWATVRCTGVREVEPEQLRMDGGRAGSLSRFATAPSRREPGRG